MVKKKENRLVVGDITSVDMIPEWMMKEIETERVMLGLASLMGRGPIIGDAEVCAYLMTASFREPLCSEHTNIYMYLVTRLFEKRDKEVPESIRKEELSDWEEHELEELRQMIYHSRGGEIHHPLLDAMKKLGKDIKKKEGKK